jgi:diaminohydroxyphosphoribosylaminopyrimidine deaminase/5-amino-6-(5-phosphoribosylamino)uracil reductase
LLDRGLVVLQVGEHGRPATSDVVEVLAGQGLHALFLEGGGQVAASFLAKDLIDRVEWFRAPILLGQDGRSAVGALALANLGSAPRFRRTSLELLGDDAWERYERI